MAASMVCSSGNMQMARMSVASSSGSSTSKVALCPAVVSGSKKLSMRASFRSAQKLQIAGSSTNFSKRTSVAVAAVASSGQSLADEIKKIVEEGSHRSVVKNASMEAVTGKEAEVEALCKKFVEETNKLIEDKSKGIISFDCQKSEFEEGTIFQFWERYTTNAAMGSYNSTKAAQAFMKEVRPLLKEPIAMVLYEYSPEAGLGPMATCVGPTGEGGLDDATGGTKGSGGGIQHKQTSSALGGGLVNLEKDDRKLHVQPIGGINLGEIADKARKLFGVKK